MDEKEQYKALLTEIVKKQSAILGPEIAMLKARSVPGLTVSDEGDVLDVQGDAQKLVKDLVDKYVELSGLIVKNVLESIFAKYPLIKKVE